MGIDFLDLVFRIEHQTGVRLEAEDLAATARRRQPPDWTAGEIVQLVLSHSAQWSCLCCRQRFFCRVERGFCPCCGVRFDLWETLQSILAEVTGVDGGRIARGSLLVRDLGMC